MIPGERGRDRKRLRRRTRSEWGARIAGPVMAAVGISVVVVSILVIPNGAYSVYLIVTTVAAGAVLLDSWVRGRLRHRPTRAEPERRD
ncbi:hypothetical protein [Herbiconiux ginsengi]|uniref:hypothetical protein n=1 Tax=Herbiconiux ginsengi TaxID=381665 RepID=UPI0011149609|nr:hypothetical protein [Herbiconiux ginsengi]